MSEFPDNKAIVLAIGNSGRQDDGLGWAFAEILEAKYPARRHTIHYRYQLQVEDAELISRAEQVVFVDACKARLPLGFAMEDCEPSFEFSFSTHALLPQTILAICLDLYGLAPKAWVLKIEGLEWGLQTGLSETGKMNLQAALAYWAINCAT